jgi:hypothetical protein
MTDIPASDTAYHRPVVNCDDFRLVDEFCNEFELESAEVFFRVALTRILGEAWSGSPAALIAWREIAAQINSPASLVDQIRAVDQLGMIYWQTH